MTKRQTPFRGKVKDCRCEYCTKRVPLWPVLSALLGLGALAGLFKRLKMKARQT